MTTKTQTSLSLDADKLTEAKAILERLGLNFSEAVNIFTNMIVAKQGLPFDVTLPNDETQDAMRDVRTQLSPQESNNKADEALPGFGMWANRQDMRDTREYLRNLRKPRYTL